MELLLDGIACETNASSIAEAIRHGADAAERDGRCVVEVHINGEQISQEKLESIDGRLAAEEIRLVTAAPRDIVHDTFSQASDALEQIDQLQQDAADQLQQDHVPQAMELLAEAVNAWMQVQEAVVKGAAFAEIDLTNLEIEGLTADGAIRRLSEQLSALIEALRNHDTIALSDALLYEMPPVIGDWNRLLSALSETAGAAASSD